MIISEGAPQRGHQAWVVVLLRKINKDLDSIVIVVCFAIRSASAVSRDRKRAQLARISCPMSFATGWEFLGFSWHGVTGRKHGYFD